ncbi:MAG: hypothetical protein GXY41_10295 [Phycisphaerae bacterium]|nr:hypothetical protein [Phycisphaerae bacterium]
MRNLFAFIVILSCVGLAIAAAPSGARLMPEGYLVAGVKGRVAKDSDKAEWAFFPAVEITDGKGVLAVEKAVTLLPCSTLEQVAQLAGDEQTVNVRLWAMVTDYRGQNYLYALYFLPVRSEPDVAPVEVNKPDESAATVPATEKESVLPDEILQMMQRNRIPDLTRLDEIAAVSDDRNLIHRTGRIQSVEEDAFVFTQDGFGQNVGQASYRLLPSTALELIRRDMQRTSGRVRYVVSGVMTEFEGQAYLLIRRAVRTYTHGNFTQ